MDRRPRLFSSRLTRTERRVYGAVTVFFLLAFLATIWPIQAAFGGALPFVLSLPFDLFYLAAILVGSFFILLGLFVWEGRREERRRPNGRADDADATRGGSA